MRRQRYAHVPTRRRPRAVVEVAARAPATFYAAWVAQTLRHGMPTRRRLGALRGLVARGRLPSLLATSTLRLFRRQARGDLDEIREEVERAWPELSSGSQRLPSEPGELSLLALSRSAALTVFVFGGEPWPLVVVKIPRDTARLLNEAAALEEAEPAAVAPWSLGRRGQLFLQEGLPGRPLPIDPISPDDAKSLEWSPLHEAVSAGFVRLASATAKRIPPTEINEAVQQALDSGLLSAPAQRSVEAAWRDVHGLEVSVLRHRDSSPQNCLVREQRLEGIVDWENACTTGAPGFDLWNFALAVVEHGVGLRRWSEERALLAFRDVWTLSAFGREAQAMARTAASCAGVPAALLDPLEVIFFARRLGRRIAEPATWAVGPQTAAKMVEIVCGH